MANEYQLDAADGIEYFISSALLRLRELGFDRDEAMKHSDRMLAVISGAYDELTQQVMKRTVAAALEGMNPDRYAVLVRTHFAYEGFAFASAYYDLARKMENAANN